VLLSFTSLACAWVGGGGGGGSLTGDGGTALGPKACEVQGHRPDPDQVLARSRCISERNQNCSSARHRFKFSCHLRWSDDPAGACSHTLRARTALSSAVDMAASTAVMLSLALALALVLGAQGQAVFSLIGAETSSPCAASVKVANVTQLKAQVRLVACIGDWATRAREALSLRPMRDPSAPIRRC
jgi:hypothetical protein